MLPRYSRFFRLKCPMDLKERLLCLVEEVRYGLQGQQVLRLWSVRSSVDQQGDGHLVQ